MPLLCLPNELLELIIIEAMPEGFEGLSLTCQRFHALGTPFRKRYNELKRRYSVFTYPGGCTLPTKKPDPIPGAMQLLVRIADEPVIARYIKTAHFYLDGMLQSLRLMGEQPRRCSSATAVAQLLADSPYLRLAGVHWEDYLARMNDEMSAHGSSSYASVFLLSLLPNVEQLHLPASWYPRDEYLEGVVAAIVHRARQPYRGGPAHSLAKLKELHSEKNGASIGHLRIEDSLRLLALPRVDTFRSMAATTSPDRLYRETLSGLVPCVFGETLESVELDINRLNTTAVVNFLRHTPRLKKFRYTWDWKHPHEGGDVCPLINGISARVGEHLEQLTVYQDDCLDMCLAYSSYKRVASVAASFRGFKRLSLLDVDYELLHQSMMVPGQDELYYPHLLCDTIPASLTHLRLRGGDGELHADVLRALFRDFAAKKPLYTPNLEEIKLLRVDQCLSRLYTEQVELLYRQTRMADVSLKAPSAPPEWREMWPDI